MDNKKAETFDEVCNKINSIKMELCELVSKLEEAEMKRKAKSLSRLIGELEHWEHTR